MKMIYISKLVCIIVITVSILSLTNASGCTGSPPMFNGLPCATTTRYWDGQKGACGCGTGDQNPFSWQWEFHTAAASQLLFDDTGSSWCGSGCGTCYEITPTGDCTTGANCAGTNTSITILVSNLCPFIGNEQWCPNPGNSNQYGYHAHFDLMDYQMSGWVDQLGWNNPVVTYKQVPCGNGGSPTCDQAAQCQCSTTQCTKGDNQTSTVTDSTSSSSDSSSSSTVTTSTSTSTSTSTLTTTSTSGTTNIPITISTSSTSGSSGSNLGCSASITQSIGSTWQTGGTSTILITNTGSKPITKVIINLATGLSSSWNIEQSTEGYLLPSWAFPIPIGASSNAAGYVFSGTDLPVISLNSVEC